MGVIMCPVVSESILAVLVLFALAGGGIIVIDWLVIRRIRRLGPPMPPEPLIPPRDQ